MKIRFSFWRSGFSTVSLGITGGLGILVPVGTQWKLGGEISANTQVLSFVKDVVFYESLLYSYGLNLVVSRSF